jgi:hypothetical protein
MTPIILAMWSYWWRAAPWAWGGQLRADSPDLGNPISNEIKHLQPQGGGHLRGPTRAAPEAADA